MPNRIILLILMLTFVFFALSAESSSCDTSVQSSNQVNAQSGTDYRSMAYDDAVNAGIGNVH